MLLGRRKVITNGKARMTPTPTKRPTHEEVRAFLSRLLDEAGEDHSALSRRLNKNPTYIHQFIHRGTPKRLREEDRRIIAEHFGVSEFDLGGPEQPSGASLNLTAQDTSYLYVPAYNISASAGPGLIVEHEEQHGELAFRRDWIKSVSNAPVDQLAVVRVDGDSMYPTLAHGDHVLIDRQQTDLLRDGIYVLRVEDSLQIKRILIHPGTRQIKIKSDNPLFDHWNDCTPDSLTILGKAVWVGRRL
jgi:SOS-response transcriptional repressor LexA